MKNIGYTIRLERKKQHMKQISLAKGICSVSYLSKIENGAAIASKEVTQLLLNRLDLAHKDISSTEINNSLHEELDFIYKEVTIHRDRKFAEEKLSYLHEIKGSLDRSTFFYLNLVILRLSLLFKQNNTSRLYIDFLEKEEKNLTVFQQYLFKKNQGIYFHQNRDIDRAIQSFTNARHHSQQIVLEVWERADLYYMLGVSAVSRGQIIETIEYSNKALNYFKKFFYFQRAMDCFLLLGIAYNKANRFEKALETYQLALKLSKELHLESFNGIIYQNIGSVYSRYLPAEAISYYKKSLTFKKGTNERLISIFSIIKEYAKSEDWNKVKQWVESGFHILNHQSDAKQDYIHHFSIYQELWLHRSLSEKVVLPAIKFFEQFQDYRHCYKYSYMLGESLFKQAKYKAAAIYFKDSQAYLLKVMEINRLEDV